MLWEAPRACPDPAWAVERCPTVRSSPIERVMPPVVPVAMLALALAVTGGVILAAGAMTDPSLVVPGVLVVAAVVMEIVAAVMMTSIRPFAWVRFRQVAAWALLAYAIQSAVIVFAFVVNDVPAGPMALFSIGLVVFATDVPLMIGFTVARYERVEG